MEGGSLPSMRQRLQWDLTDVSKREDNEIKEASWPFKIFIHLPLAPTLSFCH